MIVGRAARLGCAGAIGWSLLGIGAGPARAEDLTVKLDYVAGPGCADQRDFQAVVIARLGYDPFRTSASDQVVVRIVPRSGALDGRIEWRDAVGKWIGDQAFSSIGADCTRLVRSMGFALAVQIQLLARARAAPETSPAAPEAIPAPPRETEAPAAPPPAPSYPPSPVFAVAAGPSVGFGMASAPILFGRLLGALAWQHLSLELAAQVSVPATTRRADGAGFTQQHLLAGAAACALVRQWSACLVASAGEVRMSGVDIDRPTSARMPVVEAGLRAGVVQPLGRRFFLHGHVDALWNVTRWTATLDQVPVWTAPRLAAAIGVDTGVRFP